MTRAILFASFVLSVFSGCNLSSKYKTDLTGANWITDSLPLPSLDSLFYQDHPAPIFRKEFRVKKNLTSAMLYITAAGYYQASLNEKKIGRNYLEPAWTNYTKRIYYSEYDITGNLAKGKNCIGVSLGNGFYNPLPMKMWGNRNLRKALPTGKPQFIARLKLKYANGKTEIIKTDPSWNFSYGPVVKNNVYLGEVYDARKELPGWNNTGFNDKSWGRGVVTSGPGGKPEKAFFPAVQVSEKIKPISISTPVKDTYIIDMGVNFTGLYEIKLKGNPGDTIQFRFGERLYEDGSLNPMTTVAGQIKREGMGGPGAPDIAWQTDSYIFGHTREIWYSPVFTFHTYRYMEITGLNKKPKKEDIRGLFFHTNVSRQNSFSCSSELLNSIQQATVRTFLDNLQSVQSDCPARERFGYGGDLNATSESFIYNFDMQSFYRKTIYDWIDAMNDSVFIDTAPFVGIRYCGLSWESAFLTTQYYLYLYYNDTEIIRKLYNQDIKWMDKIERIHPNGIVDKGLSDHESMKPVPVELTGTAHYLQCALIMGEFASFMNDKNSEKHFENLAIKLTKILSERFWKKPVPGPVNRQTLFSTLLYHQVVPENETGIAVDSLLKALYNGPSGHFNTGIFGTKNMLEALSREGEGNTIFNIVNNTAFPGWGYMIDRGATTLWETWKESDNTYSNCHPMFGSVTEWFYRWLGGIRPDPENPGFKKFMINPVLPDSLDYVKCTYYSPYGKIISNWEKRSPAHQIYEITVPEESLAITRLDVKEDQVITIREKQGKDLYEPVENRKAPGYFELGAGEYVINVEKNK